MQRLLANEWKLVNEHYSCRWYFVDFFLRKAKEGSCWLVNKCCISQLDSLNWQLVNDTGGQKWLQPTHSKITNNKMVIISLSISYTEFHMYHVHIPHSWQIKTGNCEQQLFWHQSKVYLELDNFNWDINDFQSSWKLNISLPVTSVQQINDHTINMTFTIPALFDILTWSNT